MKTIELSNASRPLSEYANEVSEETIVVTSGTTPIAALVSLRDVDPESLALSTSPEFLEIIEAARHEFRSGKRLSLEAMKRKILNERTVT